MEPTQVSATYEVLQLEGLDWPLASAAVTLDVEGGIVRAARVVLGHVAPTPWVSLEAASILKNQMVTEDLANAAAAATTSSPPSSVRRCTR